MIRLPWPPTVNTYWRSICVFNKRTKIYRAQPILSRGALAYRDECAEALIGEFKYGKDSRLRLAIEAYPPDKRRRDLDNVLKATLDVLTTYRVIPDDSQIEALSIVRCPIVRGGELVLHLTPAT